MSPGCAGAHLFAGKLHSIRLSAFRQQLRKHKTTIYCVSLTENTIYDGSFFLYLQAFPAFQPTRKLLKKNFFRLFIARTYFLLYCFLFPGYTCFILPALLLQKILPELLPGQKSRSLCTPQKEAVHSPG